MAFPGCSCASDASHTQPEKTLRRGLVYPSQEVDMCLRTCVISWKQREAFLLTSGKSRDTLGRAAGRWREETPVQRPWSLERPGWIKGGSGAKVGELKGKKSLMSPDLGRCGQTQSRGPAGDPGGPQKGAQRCPGRLWNVFSQALPIEGRGLDWSLELPHSSKNPRRLMPIRSS